MCIRGLFRILRAGALGSLLMLRARRPFCRISTREEMGGRGGEWRRRYVDISGSVGNGGRVFDRRVANMEQTHKSPKRNRKREKTSTVSSLEER